MREKFSKEFKIQVVELVIKEGFSVKMVSSNLEVHPNNIYRWINEYETYCELAFCKCQFKKERKCACKIPYLVLLDVGFSLSLIL